MGKLLGYYMMPHPPIMVSEIGKGEENKICNTINSCYKIGVQVNALKPNVIIIITPHGPLFRDAVSISKAPEIFGSFADFGCGQLEFNKKINMDLTDEIISNADEYGIPIVPITVDSQREYNVKLKLDHGTMVPLYFIDKNYTDYEIVHITYGALTNYDLYRFGNAIKRAVQDVECSAVMIASGDLSHRLSDSGPYEYNPNGPIFDKKITQLLKEGDVVGVYDLEHNMIEGAGECALRSIYILLGTMDGSQIKGELLSYEGPFGVGYGVMSFEVNEDVSGVNYKQLDIHRRKKIAETRGNESVYVRLARESLEGYLKNRKFMKIPDYASEEMLTEKRGAFVSMKKGGELRGCIGTILPTTNSIAEEIIRNAVEAGRNDPRFYPVELDELEDIVFSVDVLSEPVKASKEELDPHKFGVIVTKGNRRGLLLPDLEGVDTVEKQLEIALSKGGIDKNADYQIEMFEVIRYK